MTAPAPVLPRSSASVPVLGVTTAGAPVPAVVVLPERDYFPGAVDLTPAPYEAMVGPLTPTPQRTLAEVIEAINACPLVLLDAHLLMVKP